MGNLLSNAIKFSDARSTIRITCSFNDLYANQLTVSVRDYGRGISSEESKSLFKAFVQIRAGELQKGRGSGLGLSICKNLVELHRGTITCTSIVRSGEDVESGGSTFSFSIPVGSSAATTTTSRNAHAGLHIVSPHSSLSSYSASPSTETRSSVRRGDIFATLTSDSSCNAVEFPTPGLSGTTAIVENQGPDAVFSSGGGFVDGGGEKAQPALPSHVDSPFGVETAGDVVTDPICTASPSRIFRALVCDGKIIIVTHRNSILFSVMM